MKRALLAFLTFSSISSPLFAASDPGKYLFLLALLGPLVFALLGGYVMFKRQQFPSHKRAGDSFLRYLSRDHLLRTLLALMLIVSAANVIFPNKVKLHTPEEFIEVGLGKKDFWLAETGYQALLQEDPLDWQRNVNYLENHFRIPEYEEIGNEQYLYRNDFEVRKHYTFLFARKTRKFHNVGALGLGVTAFNLGEPREALEFLGEIQGESLSHVDYYRGIAHFELGEIEEGLEALQREIEKGGQVKAATRAMAWNFLTYGQMEQVERMISQPETRKMLEFSYVSEAAVRTVQPLPYLASLFTYIFSNINLIGLIGALLITLVWAGFLLRVDLFKREKWWKVGLTVLFGAAITPFALPLYHMLEFGLGFTINGQLLNDFSYCVFGIGMIEEVIKFIPFLIVIRLFKVTDEPVDYLIYAGAAALGFAFTENLLYFEVDAHDIIHGRAVTAAFMHIFCSGLIAYGFILNQYRFEGKRPWLIPAFLGLAALCHGFYDFWLISPAVESFGLITLIFFLATIAVFGTFLNNALNHSPHFDQDLHLDLAKLSGFLLIGLSLVLVFEYTALCYEFGSEYGNGALITSMISGSYIMLLLAMNLSRVDLIEGEWEPIRIFSRGHRPQYRRAIGLKVELRPLGKQNKLADILPLTGKITERVLMRNSDHNMLLELETPVRVGKQVLKKLILRPKSESQVLHTGENLPVMLIRPKSPEVLKKSKLEKGDCSFFGWARIK